MAKGRPIEPPYYVCHGGPLDGLPLKMGEAHTLPEHFGLEKRSDGMYRRVNNGAQVTYRWEGS